MRGYRVSLICWRRDPSSSWMCTIVNKKRSGNSLASAEQRIMLLGPRGFEVQTLGNLGVAGMADVSRMVNVLELYGFEIQGGTLDSILTGSRIEVWMLLRLRVPRSFAFANPDAL
eukprot:TRINITY_DN38332_c0_g1_i2.p1 TRINITY_DN38332_c0_g1~~TRINITY_DN38332_c0_g1_i2.p1  ORF type:complete len:115 (+),score=12.15 TRINITY_DN38332_c0_g1_i2:226-570(+)